MRIQPMHRRTANAHVVERKPGQIKLGLPRFLPSGIQVSHDDVKYLLGPSRVVLGNSHLLAAVPAFVGGISIISGGVWQPGAAAAGVPTAVGSTTSG